MKRSLLKIISLKLVILFGISISANALEEPNWSYLKEIRATPRYDNYITGEVSMGIPETPVEVSGGAGGGWVLMGHEYNCFLALAKCDQNKVDFKELE